MNEPERACLHCGSNDVEIVKINDELDSWACNECHKVSAQMKIA